MNIQNLIRTTSVDAPDTLRQKHQKVCEIIRSIKSTGQETKITRILLAIESAMRERSISFNEFAR